MEKRASELISHAFNCHKVIEDLVNVLHMHFIDKRLMEGIPEDFIKNNVRYLNFLCCNNYNTLSDLLSDLERSKEHDAGRSLSSEANDDDPGLLP